MMILSGDLYHYYSFLSAMWDWHLLYLYLVYLNSAYDSILYEITSNFYIFLNSW